MAKSKKSNFDYYNDKNDNYHLKVTKTEKNYSRKGKNKFNSNFSIDDY